MKQPAFDSRPPCTQDPKSWDAPTQYEARTGRYQQRHAHALNMCRTQCPFDTRQQCYKWAIAEGPADDSILAGMTGKQREQLTGRKRARHGKWADLDVLGEGCVRGHPAEKRYRSSIDGRLRCQQCSHDYDNARNNARRLEQGCRNGHDPEEYYARPSGELVCRACELRQNAKRNAKRRYDRATRGCKNGHAPEDYYTRPSGAYVCRACELRRNANRKRGSSNRPNRIPTVIGKMVVA
jgi:hypothetical protein